MAGALLDEKAGTPPRHVMQIYRANDVGATAAKALGRALSNEV